MIESRYVKYTLTCPNGHTEIQEKMIFRPTEEEAIVEIKKQKFLCGYCKADSANSNFRIEIIMNKAMPSTSKPKK